MTTNTFLNHFIRDDAFTINKRTKRGKRALALLAESSPEYTAVLGKRDQWDDEGRIHFVLNDVEGTKSAITDLLTTYKPRPKYEPNRYLKFTLVLEGVWSVLHEHWDKVDVVTFQYNGDGTVTEKSDVRVWSSPWNLRPAQTVSSLVKEEQEAESRAQERLARINLLKETQPLTESEQYAVSRVQEFVDTFSTDAETNSNWHTDNLRNVRDLAVRMVARDIAVRLLAVVGKTTLEVGSVCHNYWRSDADTPRVIGLDEAFGKAVMYVVNNDNATDSVTRDLLGEAVERLRHTFR